MSKITVHGGSFGSGTAGIREARIMLPIKQGKGLWDRDYIDLAKLTEIEIVTEESVKRMGSKIAWAAVGSLAFGPVGLLAGLISRGNKKEMTFVAKFEGGETMLGTADIATYKKLLAASMTKS